MVDHMGRAWFHPDAKRRHNGHVLLRINSKGLSDPGGISQNTLTAGQAAVMRMEPGWLPYRRKPGKPLA